MQGILIRSRTQIIEDDEKPSNCFCNLKKHNYNSKIIPKLERKDGKVITDQSEIFNDAKMFYEDLYSNKDNNLTVIDLDSLFLNTNIRKLNTEESNKLEGLLTYKQASVTLKTMANNRSPGSDGFGADILKMFWPLYYWLFKFSFLKGELSITQRQGIITCIPKENKPRHYITNYRPISLLNCIYKIASGIIANRIKGSIQKFIHTDQSGFIAGRYIGENTRLVYDIMHHTETKIISGLLLLVDFEKAFDSVSWAFINKVLKFYGFGNSLISWIKILYRNAMLTVNQGGNLSPFFHIGRGCRQGDPVSPFLFVLCADILGIMIRNNKDIKSIVINNKEHKLSQYADDTLFILDGTSKSSNETLSVLSKFSHFSNLR